MKFGSWNVRSLYGIGSLKRVARELGKCKLDLVDIEVRCEKGGTKRAEVWTFSVDREWGSSVRDRFLRM
jgi:hypothetical protein